MDKVGMHLVEATFKQKLHFADLVEDDMLLDAFIVFDADKDIGVVWQGNYGWNTVPFAGDIGHNGFDTKEEAAQDLYEVYNEHNTKRKVT